MPQAKQTNKTHNKNRICLFSRTGYQQEMMHAHGVTCSSSNTVKDFFQQLDITCDPDKLYDVMYAQLSFVK